MVKSGNFVRAIYDALENYSDEMAAAVKQEVRAVAGAAVAELKATSPKDTGEYAEGWGLALNTETKRSLTITVGNKDHYQLTHLLENGHAKVGGGRVAARVHIAPVRKQAARQLRSQVKAVLQK